LIALLRQPSASSNDRFILRFQRTINASRSPLTSRSTSVILRALGNAARMRIPTDYCGNICPRALTSRPTRKLNSTRSLADSTNARGTISSICCVNRLNPQP